VERGSGAPADAARAFQVSRFQPAIASWISPSGPTRKTLGTASSPYSSETAYGAGSDTVRTRWPCSSLYAASSSGGSSPMATTRTPASASLVSIGATILQTGQLTLKKARSTWPCDHGSATGSWLAMSVRVKEGALAPVVSTTAMVSDLGGTLPRMATKKKRNRPRPQSGPRPASKPPGKAAARPREKTGPTRAERLAAAEAARRRKAARTRALMLGSVVAVVALLTVTIVASRRSNDRTVARLEAGGACRYDTKADTDAGAGNNHVPGDLKYDTNPPAGGNHNPTAAGAGVYTAANTPPDGQLVHALEHGYVDIWYRPDLDPAALDDLTALAGRHDRDVLLMPRASLAEPVAATAWHRRLLCSRPDAKALESFVTAYANKGPEKVAH
jgi:hypothetical protein